MDGPISSPIAEPSMAQAGRAQARHGVTLREAVRVWLRVAMLSFGGPAGQIAVMHRIIVEEKRWISEARFPRVASAGYSGWCSSRRLLPRRPRIPASMR